MMFVVNDGRIGYTGLGMLVAFSPIAILFISMFAMRNPSKTGASLLYWTVVSLIGAGLGVVALIYTGESLASTFFITAATFGALSLWGYTTKRDLTGFGTFLFMGMIGLVLVAGVNIFLKSTIVMFAISGVGVLLTSGMIAYHTQGLKFDYYYAKGNQTAMSVATSIGALNLYISFINLFQFLLTFLGDRE
jgi:FtsH-binding integral membrane protein